MNDRVQKTDDLNSDRFLYNYSGKFILRKPSTSLLEFAGIRQPYLVKDSAFHVRSR